MPKDNELTYVKLEEVRDLLKPGMVALVRGNSIYSTPIRIFFKSDYTHAALIDINEWNEPDIIEFHGYYKDGGKEFPLEDAILSDPGIIDIYEVVPEYIMSGYTDGQIEKCTNIYDADCTLAEMRKIMTNKYSWWKIFQFVWMNLFFIRLFGTPSDFNMDEAEETDEAQVCSSAVAYAFSRCGYDLVKHKNFRYTTPGDLAQSPLLSYLFTLEA